MEYGLSSQLRVNEYNSQEKIQSVNELSALNALKSEKETNKLDNEYKTNELSKSEKVVTSKIQQYNEVVLSNLNFGFNDNSKDFFVKVTRGEAENKYPTDDMMRLKAYLMSLNKEVS